MTLIEFTQRYATVKACLEHLRQVRWSDGEYCPHCGGTKIYSFKDGLRHKCGDCRRIFRLITGTIFGDSPIKLLPKWFAAIYIDTCHSKGISSVQLAKMIDVQQKTAWFMLHRIREALGNDDAGMIGGDVEIAETYLGGKEKNKRQANRVKGTQGRNTKTKRGGLTKAFKVEAADGRSVIPRMFNNMALGFNVRADRVCHSAVEYVRGDIHTNSIESFWAFVERIHTGIHHHWSGKHTQHYLNSCAFRLNNRKLDREDRVSHLLRCAIGVRLTYMRLIA